VRTVLFCVVVVPPPPQAASTKATMTSSERSSVAVLVLALNTEEKELGVIVNLLKIADQSSIHKRDREQLFFSTHYTVPANHTRRQYISPRTTVIELEVPLISFVMDSN
jgi:hypothetical protein